MTEHEKSETDSPTLCALEACILLTGMLVQVNMERPFSQASA